MNRARSAVVLLVVALGCRHSSDIRWSRQDFLIADAPATEATTHQPVYAQARPGSANAIVYPGPEQDRPRKDDPRAQAIFEILSRGAECGDALATGSVEKCWNRFSDAARNERRDLDSFRKLVESTLTGLGQETRLRGEYVVRTPKGVSYLRDSEWSKAPNGMVLELAFAPDSTSQISGLSFYRSETRPIVVKIGESANAPR